MAFNPYTTDSSASSNYYFGFFKNLDEFNNQGLQAVNSIKANNSNYFNEFNRISDSQFVRSRDKAFLDEGKFLEYVDKPELDNTISAFDDMFANIDMGGAFNKSRLITSENKKGVFDFSLASRGLYALQEFFSQELADKFPFEFPVELPGIVPPINVDKNQMGDYWYTSFSGEKFQCVKQDKGTRAIEMKIPGAKIQYGTTTKKAYVMFEKKGGKAKMVDLYVGVGGLGTMEASGMMARAMPLFLAARYFEMAGIRTRINAARMYTSGSGLINYSWTIKDYGDDIDFNFMAINTSDPRFFRWNLWKYVKALLKTEHNIQNNGYGSTIYGGNQMLECGNRYKNWYFEQMQKGILPDLGIDRNLMIFGGIENPADTYNINSSQKRDIETTQKIIEEFFRILDIVDFQFNKSEKAADRIYKRMVIDGGKSTQDFKTYVNKILATAYSYPARGQYATDADRIFDLNEEFDKKIEDVNNYLITII